MVSKIPKINKYNKGVTLVEIVVIIFIIALLSLMVISDFPKILREYALSRGVYDFSQSLRTLQDFSLSGVIVVKDSDECPVPAKGYGVYLQQTIPIVTSFMQM